MCEESTKIPRVTYAARLPQQRVDDVAHHLGVGPPRERGEHDEQSRGRSGTGHTCCTSPTAHGAPSGKVPHTMGTRQVAERNIPAECGKTRPAA